MRAVVWAQYSPHGLQVWARAQIRLALRLVEPWYKAADRGDSWQQLLELARDKSSFESHWLEEWCSTSSPENPLRLKVVKDLEERFLSNRGEFPPLLRGSRLDVDLPWAQQFAQVWHLVSNICFCIGGGRFVWTHCASVEGDLCEKPRTSSIMLSTANQRLLNTGCLAGIGTINLE